jgi:hypothetical protein
MEAPMTKWKTTLSQEFTAHRLTKKILAVMAGELIDDAPSIPGAQLDIDDAKGTATFKGLFDTVTIEPEGTGFKVSRRDGRHEVCETPNQAMGFFVPTVWHCAIRGVIC